MAAAHSSNSLFCCDNCDNLRSIPDSNGTSWSSPLECRARRRCWPSSRLFWKAISGKKSKANASKLASGKCALASSRALLAFTKRWVEQSTPSAPMLNFGHYRLTLSTESACYRRLTSMKTPSPYTRSATTSEKQRRTSTTNSTCDTSPTCLRACSRLIRRTSCTASSWFTFGSTKVNACMEIDW